MQLPITTWGQPAAARRALLIHGINGAGATWWRLGGQLAERGWHVTAVDLRGHGDADRTDSYLLDEYVTDLPDGPWDLVLGHSLGGAIGVRAAGRPGFTRALALLDPVLRLPEETIEEVRAEQLAELTTGADELAAARPHWDRRDVDAKAAASARSDSRMVDLTFDQNRPWNLVAEAAALTVPTLAIAADPAVFTMFPAEVRDAVRSPAWTTVEITAAGHSPHRDRPDETLRILAGWLSDAGIVTNVG